MVALQAPLSLSSGFCYLGSCHHAMFGIVYNSDGAMEAGRNRSISSAPFLSGAGHTASVVALDNSLPPDGLGLLPPPLKIKSKRKMPTLEGEHIYREGTLLLSSQGPAGVVVRMKLGLASSMQ